MSSNFTKRWVPKQTVLRRLDAKRYILDPMFISHFRLRIPLRIRGFIFFTLNLNHPVYSYKGRFGEHKESPGWPQTWKTGNYKGILLHWKNHGIIREFRKKNANYHGTLSLFGYLSYIFQI